MPPQLVIRSVTAGDLSFAVQFNDETLWHFAQLRYPRVEEELYKSSMCTTESPIIQLLEKNLLDLASYSNMIEGVFYVLSLNNQGETTVIRLSKSDCYIGFF